MGDDVSGSIAKGFKFQTVIRPRAWAGAFSFLAVALAGLAAGCGGSHSSPAPSNLTYPQASITAAVGQAIAADSPTVSGTVNSYSVSPALPPGLTVSTSSGTLSGTPTAAAPKAAYTVTAQNTAGSTSATLQITVTLAAPANLAYPAASIVATVGQAITPDVPTVTGTVASYGISPALPPGLTIDTATGVIAGTPTASSASSAYTVTAQNSGGSTTASVTIAVSPATLLDLGHADKIQVIRVAGDRVLSVDQPGHWVLWGYSSGTSLADGDGSPSVISVETNVIQVQQADLAGSVFAIAIPDGLQIRSASDGHLLSSVSYPGLNQVPTGTRPLWWQLASDGSYICIGSQTGVSFYSAAGQLIASKAGDYSLAKTFAAPGNLQVGLGAAGQSVVETISAASGTSTVSAPFQGQFNSWFIDGARFLTNQGNTVWVYSNTGAQQGIAALPTVEHLTGQGNWIWTYAWNTPGTPVDVYPIGSETAALTISPIDASSLVFGSGSTIGVLGYGAGHVTVVDLSGPKPTSTDYSDAIAYLGAYGADSSSRWVVGNQHGALVDGASLATTPRYFGYGQAWSIAGSSSNVAVSTASGKILVFDPSGPTLDQTIAFPSAKVALSSDGTVLAAAADWNDAQYAPDRTLNLYSLPSAAVIKSYPYVFQDGLPDLFDFTLSGSGAILGQTIGTIQNRLWTYLLKVTPAAGGSVLWSDTPASVGSAFTGLIDPILLSPEGTLVGEFTGQADASASTNIFKNGAVVTAVPGVGLGWIDNSRILVNQYGVTTSGYDGAAIYDTKGSKLASVALPELKSIQVVTADSVYSPSNNAIYSLATGQATWSGSLPASGKGAVSGGFVVYQSGHSLVLESH